MNISASDWKCKVWKDMILLNWMRRSMDNLSKYIVSICTVQYSEHLVTTFFDLVLILNWRSNHVEWMRMNIWCVDNNIYYEIVLTLTRSSFSTLNLTSNQPGPLRADSSFLTVVFWELPFSHSLIMDNITFLRARSDQPRSSRA